LKAKVGGGLGGVDMAAIRRAEAAMETLKREFQGWAESDVLALLSARERYAKSPDAKSRKDLLRAAHDIKGQAATFDFPLIARVAGSLSKLLDEAEAAPPALVDAHVTAIQVIHRKNLTGAEDKLALTLIAELDKQVAEILRKK